MLLRLDIRNYALVEELGLEFGPGLNALSGETGSGKSIVVDALGLLLGERAEAGAIRAGAATASVAGAFAAPWDEAARAAFSDRHGLEPLGDELQLRRDIAANGRSRAWLDHQPVTLGLLRQFARNLGEIHSQYEALTSFQPAAQLALLDRFGDHEPLLRQIAAAHAAWRAAETAHRAWQAEARLRLQQADLWRFQAQELRAAAPRAGEDNALELEQRRLGNAERIAAAAQAAWTALYDAPEAATVQLKAALKQLQELERCGVEAAPLVPRLEALRVETADLARQVMALAEGVDADPRRLAAVDERLALLDRLKHKYGPTLNEVVACRDRVEKQLAAVDGAAQAEAGLAARADETSLAYRELAATLGKKRRAAAARLKPAVEAEVADLAMTLRFSVEFAATPEDTDAWGANGWDSARFLVAMNPGEPPGPVESIASGGELSRLLLALHLVAQPASAPRQPVEMRRTLVLDEVDAGLGGRAAEAVGRKLQRLARDHQVLCVTHLPQIAAFADRHLRVEKETAGGRTRTRVTALSGEARVAEVARMLAGRVNATALKHAEELIAAHASG